MSASVAYHGIEQARVDIRLEWDPVTGTPYTVIEVIGKDDRGMEYAARFFAEVAITVPVREVKGWDVPNV